MFLSLLPVTLGTAILTSILVMLGFRKPIRTILEKIVSETLAPAWTRFMNFVVFVVGVSCGVDVYKIERYVFPQGANSQIPPFTLDLNRWMLEIYSVSISSLKGIAWALMMFFMVTLVVFAVVRVIEAFAARTARKDPA